MSTVAYVSYLEKWWEDELAEKIAAQAELDYSNELFQLLERKYAPKIEEKKVNEKPEWRSKGPGNFPAPSKPAKPVRSVERENCQAPAEVNFLKNDVRIFVPCTAYARLAIEYWNGEKAAKPFHSTTVPTNSEPIFVNRVRFANPNGRLIMTIYGLPEDIHGSRKFLGEFREGE